MGIDSLTEDQIRSLIANHRRYADSHGGDNAISSIQILTDVIEALLTRVIREER